MRLALFRARLIVAVIVAAAVVSAGTVARAPAADPPGATLTLRGAGATFPAALYEKWIQAYQREHAEVSIHYDAVGSSEGQKRYLAETVDFGASDAALRDDQLVAVKAGARLVPVTAGIVVLAYRLPGVNGPLRLSREVCLGIFSGRIRSWNDPKIREANPDLNLPNRSIGLVARQDGSGTTFALTNHLSAISPTWRDQGAGVGNLVDWGGRAMLARGNEGVAARVKANDYTLGYMEYGYAQRLGLATAWLQNRAGKYVRPVEAGGQAAISASAKQMPENMRLFMPDPPGEESYPIVTFSWLLLYDRYPDAEKATALKKFVAWGLTTGQNYSRELGYIVLPPEVASMSLAALDRIR